MRGAEGRPAQPAFQQFGERSGSQQGSAVNFVRGIVQQRQLNVGDINDYCLMWSDMKLNAHRGLSSEAYQTVKNVSRGLDFVLFDKVRPTQQGSILRELAEIQQEEDIDRIVLPYADATLLRSAAAAVNIAYDPGSPENTPENLKKRTFVFADLKQKAESKNVSKLTRVVPDVK